MTNIEITCPYIDDVWTAAPDGDLKELHAAILFLERLAEGMNPLSYTDDERVGIERDALLCLANDAEQLAINLEHLRDRLRPKTSA